jgi:hypothetical protein
MDRVGGPAFPVPADTHLLLGMTLRDYFAAKALAGIVTKGIPADPQAADTYARYAFMLADSMLRERAK